MSNIFYTSRSAIETHQRCPRRRYYGYLYQGRGISRVAASIPLVTGTHVHLGLEHIFKQFQSWDMKKVIVTPEMVEHEVDTACNNAVESYRKELKGRGFIRVTKEAEGDSDYNQYTIDEQCALCEALIRAFSIQVLPKMLGEYKILDVEREETFTLTSKQDTDIILQGKVDVILQSKESEGVTLVSFKTAKQYDSDPRVEKNASHDNQGISETLCIRERFKKEEEVNKEFFRILNEVGNKAPDWAMANVNKLGVWCNNHEKKLHIEGVQMVYLLKGKRYESEKGSGKYIDISPLIRGYRKVNQDEDGYDYAWSWDFANPYNKSGKGKLGGKWERFDVWTDFEGGVKGWIELLCSHIEGPNGEMIPVIQPEAGFCIVKQIVMPALISRGDEEIESWVRQIKVQETEIFQNVDTLQNEIGNATPIDYILDEMFPMYRHSCHYPSDCEFVDICYDSEVRENPLAVSHPVTGETLFRYRTPHHTPEEEQHKRRFENDNNTK